MVMVVMVVVVVVDVLEDVDLARGWIRLVRMRRKGCAAGKVLVSSDKWVC